jgi:hypothetical protein
VVAEPVEEAVVDAVLTALSKATLRTRGSLEERDQRLVDAEREMEEIRVQRDEYARDAADGRITRAEWMIVRERLAERQRRAEVILGGIQRPRSAVLDSVPSGRDQLESWWAEASFAKQREVLRVLIERVVVKPASHHGNSFDPTRLSPPVWRF